MFFASRKELIILVSHKMMMVKMSKKSSRKLRGRSHLLAQCRQLSLHQMMQKKKNMSSFTRASTLCVLLLLRILQRSDQNQLILHHRMQTKSSWQQLQKLVRCSNVEALPYGSYYSLRQLFLCVFVCLACHYNSLWSADLQSCSWNHARKCGKARRNLHPSCARFVVILARLSGQRTRSKDHAPPFEKNIFLILASTN